MDSNDGLVTRKRQCDLLIYKSFSHEFLKNSINLTYQFEIPNVSNFEHKLIINNSTLKIRPTSINLLNAMVFNIGMCILLEYLKINDCKKIKIECNSLDEIQVKWWENYYRDSTKNNFLVNIISTNDTSFSLEKIIYDDNDFSGYIVPIEDNNCLITLASLNISKDSDFCVVFKKRNLDIIKDLDFSSKNIIEVSQEYDKKILEVFDNDLSGLIAFVSYLLCYLLSKKYVAVSNTSFYTNYGKSFDFENNFRKYADNYLPTPVEYFSYLRPLNNMQIAKSYAKINCMPHNKIDLDSSHYKISLKPLKLNCSFYLPNNLIPEQEFLLKKFLL